MKTFEEKMQYIRDFLFDVMKPSIREFIYFDKPKEFEKWEGACCRQTSLITNWFLRDWLLKNRSGYKEIQSWEGNFIDMHKGKELVYDHAWIYCVHEDSSRNLLIDIGRTTKPILFVFTPVNEYPENIPGYDDMVCISKERMNEKELWRYNEHFTGKAIRDIIPKLTKYMKSQGMMKSSARNVVDIL